VKCKSPFRLKGTGYVPCGKCAYCRMRRSTEWTDRLQYAQLGKKSWFITLTYDDDNLPENASLRYSDVQKYHKRLRKSGLQIQYYTVGEYGDDKDRPHYHSIYYSSQDIQPDSWRDHWPHGFVHIGTATADSIRYCAKYAQKKITGKQAEQHYNGRLPERALFSPSLGHEHMRPLLEGTQMNYGASTGPIPRWLMDWYRRNDLNAYEGLKQQMAQEKKIRQEDVRNDLTNMYQEPISDLMLSLWVDKRRQEIAETTDYHLKTHIKRKQEKNKL